MGDGKWKSKYYAKKRETELLILAIHESGDNVRERVNKAMNEIIKRHG